MESGTKVMRILGIDIYLHFSWWFIFVILAWSLAGGFFPQYYPNLTAQSYWLMGISAALLLFVSVLLHELSHSLVARWKKIKVNSITLFFFGGVAGISKEDIDPKSEFFMAIAGPLFSFVLAGVCYGLYRWDGNFYVTAITYYLFQLNLVLAIFNLVPGYPLDGGRAFRAILYGYFKDLKKATRIAAGGGKFVAGVLFFLGLYALFAGTANGLWFVLLGGFLYVIAGASYEQVVVKETLSSVKVEELLQTDLPLLSADLLFSEFLKKDALSGKRFFVVQGAAFQGIIDLQRLAQISPQLQKVMKVKQLALPLSRLPSLTRKASAYTAFRFFSEKKTEIIPVKEKKQIMGYITRDQVMNRLIVELKFNDPHPAHVVARVHRRR
ncbi:site-2 protease family protein [Candidatus Woesearchaeota archaeon]|nr:site-2 protease family protein [Candidatus Woesearchaeota archaeon]